MDPSKWGCAFEVSAPGKVILHGEHSVVHGGTALAASLGLRTKLQVLPSPNPESLRVDFPNIGLQRDYSITDIKRTIFSHNILRDVIAVGKDEEISYGAALTLLNGLKTEDELLQPEQETAVACLFHLILCAGHKIIAGDDSQKEHWPIIPAATFHVDTQLPIGAGAGSSAAFCVCIAAASLHLAHSLVYGNYAWGFADFTKETLHQISCMANSGERIMHGKPSGVDSAVATFGGVVQFKSGQVDPIGKVPLRVLLVDSGVGRQTKAMVAAVRDRLERHPTVVLCILEAMDKLALQALELLKSLMKNPDDQEAFHALEELLDMNQGLLWSLGVSHPSLDRILSFGSSIACLHGKLTGAGGGGLAYLLLSPYNIGTSETRENALQKLKTCLSECGFRSEEVRLGGPGITISPLTEPSG